MNLLISLGIGVLAPSSPGVLDQIGAFVDGAPTPSGAPFARSGLAITRIAEAGS
jgi:hypothetical protein